MNTAATTEQKQDKPSQVRTQSTYTPPRRFTNAEIVRMREEDRQTSLRIEQEFNQMK